MDKCGVPEIRLYMFFRSKKSRKMEGGRKAKHEKWNRESREIISQVALISANANMVSMGNNYPRLLFHWGLRRMFTLRHVFYYVFPSPRQGTQRASCQKKLNLFTTMDKGLFDCPQSVYYPVKPLFWGKDTWPLSPALKVPRFSAQLEVELAKFLPPGLGGFPSHCFLPSCFPGGFQNALWMLSSTSLLMLQGTGILGCRDIRPFPWLLCLSDS